MKKTLLNYIVCPIDKSELEVQVREATDGEITEGHLACSHGHNFTIEGGIPNLLQQDGDSDDARQTQETFSRKWTRVPDFGHEEKSREMFVRWYLDRYGFGTIEGLQNFLADKGRVLDAGTGLGRDARLYADNCPGEVFAVDLSDSIIPAYAHVGHLPNVHVIRADLTCLPFRRETFDYIACDQVIHHTPSSEQSFSHLSDHLAPGGQISTYVYKRKAPIREFCDDYLRSRYTASTDEECLEFCDAITQLGKTLSDLNVEIDVPTDIPALGIRAGKQNLQRFVYWNMFKCFWNDDLDFETNMLANYDWYRPKYAHRHTPSEVKTWCWQEHLEIEHFDIVDSGISVRARKPLECAA